MPFIPFKVNDLGGSPRRSALWSKLLAMFMFNREVFLDYYHRRSNVETTFSMIKGKFGDAVRSKSETGQHNEVLKYY